MQLALFGATGATGRLILEQALKAGHSVTAFVRNPADLGPTSARVVQGDSSSLEAMKDALKGSDAVVSALGARTRKKNTVRSEAAKNLAAAAQATGVKRVVWLSSAGVGDSLDQAKRSSFIYGRIMIPLMLKDAFADSAVAEDILRKGVSEAVIVRPVGLTNGPHTGQARVSLDGQKLPHLFISRADVADFMLKAATAPDYVGKSPVIFGQ